MKPIPNFKTLEKKITFAVVQVPDLKEEKKYEFWNYEAFLVVIDHTNNKKERIYVVGHHYEMEGKEVKTLENTQEMINAYKEGKLWY